MKPIHRLLLAILAVVAGIGLSGGLLRAYGMPVGLVPIDWPVWEDRAGQTTLSGRYPKGGFGWSMAVGDINGDRVADLITNAIDGSDTLYDDGEVYVIPGPLSISQNYVMPEQAALIFTTTTVAQLGARLATGDMNGDGIDDIAMSSVSGGEIFVSLGSSSIQASSPRTIPAAPEQMALSVYSAVSGLALCDFNGDGYQDLFLREYILNSGEKIWGILGSSSLTTTQPVSLTMPADAQIIIEGFGLEGYGSGGNQTMACGDFDGDGTPDLAVGRSQESPQNRYLAGSVYVIPGDPGITAGKVVTLTMPAQAGIILDGIDGYQWEGGDQLGNSLAAADIDRDGNDDLIIGAPGGWGVNNWYGFAGEVYLWLGRSFTGQRLPISDQATWVVYGEDIYNYLGISVSTGDFDEDGAHEVLVGCPECDIRSGPYSIWGKAYALEPLDFRGVAAIQKVSQMRILSNEFSNCLGWPVNNIDLDQDGASDLLVSAPCSGYYIGDYQPGTIYAITYPIRTRVFLPFVQQTTP